MVGTGEPPSTAALPFLASWGSGWGALSPSRPVLIAALALAGPPARAGSLGVDVGPTRVEGRVASFRELRDQAIVRQQYDYSCGAAAFATLLRHGFGDEVTEDEILRRVFSQASDAEQRLIQNKGLSLLDMQRLARERGYKAQGFRLAADQLARIPRPVIVFIRPLGYEHFAVLKGIRGDRAFLADPSRGNQSLPLYRFLDMWRDASGDGVALVVEKPDGRWPAEGPLQLGAQEPWGAAPLTIRDLLEVGRPIDPPARSWFGR